MSADRDGLGIEVFSSVGGAAFFERLAREWEAAGASVAFRNAVSEAEYRKPRGKLGRAILRWRMYAGYSAVCLRGAFGGRRREAVRIVTTNPFFAPALVARVSGRKGATINLLYDLFPEALIQAGIVSQGSFAARLCGSITRHALRECDATVFLGERLRVYAESAYGAARRSAVIPVGADGRPFESFPPLLPRDGAPPRVLYSGLMGAMHDWETIAAALRSPEAGSLSWVFHSRGSGYSRLRRAGSGDSRVSWGGSLPDIEWREAMKLSHVALVTIARGAERVVMPSKTYSALVAGQAILAICPPASDLADLVAEHDCGWVLAPGDVAGLRRVLDVIARRPDELLEKRRKAFAAGHGVYDMGRLAGKWLDLFRELARDRTV